MAWFRHPVPSAGSAIAFSSVPQTSQRMLKAITISWDIAPAAVGDLTITLDSGLGTPYDVELYVVD